MKTVYGIVKYRYYHQLPILIEECNIEEALNELNVKYTVVKYKNINYYLILEELWKK